jgi:hypothetical protein
MKKCIVLLILTLATTIAAGAQGTLMPKGGDIGVGASVSTSTSTILGYYHLSDTLILAPQIGIHYQNFAAKSGSTTTDYPGTWVDIGCGLYWTVLPFEAVSLQVGPALEIAYRGYTDTTDGDDKTFTYWALNLNARVVAMISKNFGFFTTFGAYYSSADTEDKTTSTGIVQTDVGIESVSLGVVYYFK